jgi:fatty acid desaturase
VREYRSLPAWRRALYRLTRHPIVVLGLGPFYLFVLKHRLPVRLMRAGREPWLSVMSTNLAIAVVVGLLVALLGARDFLLVQTPITLLASSAGVWLFYVQHQSSAPGGRGTRTGTCTPAPCTAARTRSAARAALVHGQYPSRPSSAQPDPCYRLGEALRGTRSCAPSVA